MTFTTSIVQHTFLDASGSPAVGEVEFTLEQQMTNGSVTMLAGTFVVATLDASGNLSQQLVSTEDPGTVSQGLAQWRSDLRVSGADERTEFLQVPSGGVVADYAALTLVPQDFG